MSFNRSLLCLLIAMVIFSNGIVNSAFAEETPPQTNSEFDSFANFRTELLARIGGASKRVWVSTNFLTDAEIVSSLYIAQYRKVQISVLLGREKANHILSRLGYLKQVNIPVAIKPKHFYDQSPTLVLIDDKLFSANSDLDYLAKRSKFTLKEMESTELATYESAFQEAAKDHETPEVRPLPLVGSQRPHKSRNHGPKSLEDKNPAVETEAAGEEKPSIANKDKQQPTFVGGETGSDGVYRYRRVKDRPAAGVPTKLPKMTLGQELEKKRAASGNQTEDEAAGTP